MPIETLQPLRVTGEWEPIVSPKDIYSISGPLVRFDGATLDATPLREGDRIALVNEHTSSCCGYRRYVRLYFCSFYQSLTPAEQAALIIPLIQTLGRRLQLEDATLVGLPAAFRYQSENSAAPTLPAVRWNGTIYTLSGITSIE